MSFGRGGRYFFGLMELQQNRPAADKTPWRLGWPLASALISSILALLAAFIFYRLETWPRRAVGRSVTELERLGREGAGHFRSSSHTSNRG